MAPLYATIALFRALVTALAYAWSSPLGLIGLAVGGALHATGLGRATWQDGAQIVTVGGRLGAWFWNMGWAGFTVGWSMLLWLGSENARPSPVVIRHERRHVWHALVFGVLLWPLYLLGLALRGYRRNWFEVDARRAAGQPV